MMCFSVNHGLLVFFQEKYLLTASLEAFPTGLKCTRGTADSDDNDPHKWDIDSEAGFGGFGGFGGSGGAGSSSRGTRF